MPLQVNRDHFIKMTEKRQREDRAWRAEKEAFERNLKTR